MDSGISHNEGVYSFFANVPLIARVFYAKLGFEEVGEIFLEADIEHINMVLT